MGLREIQPFVCSSSSTKINFTFHSVNLLYTVVVGLKLILPFTLSLSRAGVLHMFIAYMNNVTLFILITYFFALHV